MKILVGWKAWAAFLDRNVRTIKRWHYERLALPYWKSDVGPQGKNIMTDVGLLDWVQRIHHQRLVGATTKYTFPNRKKAE